MKTSRLLCFFAILPGLFAAATASGQALTGTSLSVTGAGASNLSGVLNVVGAIDSDSNTFTFGTQGSSYGGALLYTDSSTDTLKFLINRNPAAWAWVHNTNITAMRLDSAHQLILYQANGTTAGVTLTPVSNQISLGTATLTGSGTGLTAGGAFTATGALTASAGITNTNGSLTGGASGLTLNAGGTNQNITLTPSGTGGLLVSGNSTGKTLATFSSGPLSGDINTYFRVNASRSDSEIQVKSGAGAVIPLSLQPDGGNVGIGTTAPDAPLHAVGGTAMTSGWNRTAMLQSTYPVLTFNSNATKLAGIGYDSGAAMRFWVNANSNDVSGTGLLAMSILNGGNVGFATGNPSTALQVGTSFQAESSTAVWVYNQLNGGSKASPGDLYINYGSQSYDTYIQGTKFVVKSSGNVGIGTTSPGTRRLNIQTSDPGNDLAAEINIARTTGTNYGLAASATGSGASLNQGGFFSASGGSSNFGLRIYNVAATAANYALYSDSAAQSYFQGNVGIGTSSPTGKLQLGIGNAANVSEGVELARLGGPATRFSMKLKSDAGGYYRGALEFTPNGGTANEVISISNEASGNPGVGNVGIGTTTPTSRLDVAGDGSNAVVISARSRQTNAYLGLFTGTADDAVGEFAFERTGANAGNVYIGGNATGNISFRSGGYASKMVINPLGNVTLNYGQLLLVPGSGSVVTDGNYGVYWHSNGGGVGISDYGLYRTPGGWTGNYQQLMMKFVTGIVIDGGNAYGKSGTVLQPNGGNVGIGTTSPGNYKLSVNGTIRAKEIIVDTGWADYVFDESYRLAPLAEVEQHIRSNKHLPGIPSAAEIAEHGVSMGDMQSKLLSKIEELTLHMIRLEKENNELRQRMQKIEATQ